MATDRMRLGCLLLLFLIFPAGQGESAPASFLSDRGLFRVSYTNSLDPPVINRIHEWILHIERVDGKPVEDASVTIDGGMPAHNHGLPTRPRVTAYLGEGNYRVQGLRFHMSGEWLLTITVDDANVIDSVSIVVLL